jgi:hypothetical protein
MERPGGLRLHGRADLKAGGRVAGEQAEAEAAVSIRS